MELYEIGLTWVGTKFKHMGRSRRGVDCIGLMMMIAAEAGIQAKDNPHYGREPGMKNEAYGLRDYLAWNCGDPVDREPQPNDILLLQLPKQTAPGHLGIAAPHPHGVGIIHTYGQVGKVVYHRIDPTWRGRIVEVYPCPV